MNNFVKFTEQNDWEGETWHFYIPLEGNEDELKKLEELITKKDQYGETFRLDMTPIPENEIDIIVKHSDSGYMNYHNKCHGKKLTCPTDGQYESNFLNKGEIMGYVK